MWQIRNIEFCAYDDNWWWLNVTGHLGYTGICLKQTKYMHSNKKMEDFRDTTLVYTMYMYMYMYTSYTYTYTNDAENTVYKAIGYKPDRCRL